MFSQNHGYDNDESSMHAIFIADGPFATLLKERENAAHQRQAPSEKSALSSAVYRMLPLPGALRRTMQPLSGSLSPSVAEPTEVESRKEPQAIEQFDNVEIYNLIVKLLGLTKFAAPNNGTSGFWDRYLQ